ncbi:hypothetical protein [Parasitella parasitica]|uniref:Uncharacterized protein n=1 Tax=Parasitella parasitica TaxID=35722 RepID=A0A0B7MUY7_9FUNG|nr:hypothetical protein [Parasitella parasitica]
MSTIILDKYSDDMILYPNDGPESLDSDPSFDNDPPFSLVAELSSNKSILSNESHFSEFSSEEEDFDFDMTQQPHAPPPSPQAKPMMDIFFSEKLSDSLGACLVENDSLKNNTTTTETSIFSNHLEKHAQALDTLLRKTVEGRASKRNSKRSSLRLSNAPRARSQLFKSIVENELCRRLDEAYL